MAERARRNQAHENSRALWVAVIAAVAAGASALASLLNLISTAGT